VNPAPRSIVADGQIRCLNLFNGHSVLLPLADATTLRVQVRELRGATTVDLHGGIVRLSAVSSAVAWRRVSVRLEFHA
jgi:hypothetical protein